MKKRRIFHIYLFRHGQTYYNRDGIFTGWKDSNLTPLGMKQAETVAKKLKNKKILAAFQTSLSRSKDTLKEVLKFHPECRIVITDDRIIERSYGDLEGISHEEFIERIGEKIYNLEKCGDALENFSSQMRKKAKKLFGKNEYNQINRGYKTYPPNGESLYMVEKRVKKFIISLKKFMTKNKINSVAISAHGNSIRMFRKIMEKKSEEEMQKWFIPYDKVFEYTIKT